MNSHHAIKVAHLAILLLVTSCIINDNQRVSLYESGVDVNYRGVSSKKELTTNSINAYKDQVITLSPPINQYAGIPMNCNKSYISSPDFLGIRVDLNTPHSTVREIGQHPASIYYAFKSGYYIVETFAADGAIMNSYIITNNSRSR